MRHAFTLIELLVVIALVLILCVCVLGPGSLEAPLVFAIGWVKYPIRLYQERDFDWPNSLLCAICLFAFTLGVHYFGRWFASQRPTPTVWPWSRTLKLVGILMLMFLAGITAIGITHEGTWLVTNKYDFTIDKNAARTRSTANLKYQSLGAHTHHDVHRQFPAGGTFDSNGRALHGWETALLPYLEQDALFSRIDRTVPWNHPKNAAAMSQEISIFLNPIVQTKTHDGDALSHYAGNAHVFGAKPLTVKDITDGLSNTLLMGEVAHDFKPWGMPMNCRDPAVGLSTPIGFASPQGKYVMFAFGDGTVRSINPNISPAVLKAFATPRGGENVDWSELD